MSLPSLRGGHSTGSAATHPTKSAAPLARNLWASLPLAPKISKTNGTKESPVPAAELPPPRSAIPDRHVANRKKGRVPRFLTNTLLQAVDHIFGSFQS